MHPTGGSLRVFRQFAWLEVGSVKLEFSRPAHQRVTQAVKRALGSEAYSGGNHARDSATRLVEVA